MSGLAARGRRRILLCAFEYGPLHVGGLGTMLTALCRGLESTEFQPVVVLPGSGARPAWPQIGEWTGSRCRADILRDRGTEVWMLRNATLDAPGIYPDDALHEGMAKTDEYGRCLAELLEHMDVDLVHLHDAYAYRCLDSCRRLGLPSVLTVHRLHDDEPLFAQAERAALERVDELTTVSASYAREQAAFFGRHPRVHVLPNGIDLGLWSPDDDAIEDRQQRRRRLLARMRLPERPTFAYVGRLDPDQKGVDVLLDAWTEGCAELEANLLICGEGDDALRARVQTCASRDAQRVCVVDRYCPQAEVRELFGAIDCAIIPSRYEPFGLIQLEALVMGALVIGSRTGGLADVLIDRAAPCGFASLVEVGDTAALARAIHETCARLVHEPSRCLDERRLGAARARVYSAPAMAARYAAFYGRVLAASRPQ